MLIVAKTYMRAMPETCDDCDYCSPSLTRLDRGVCAISDMSVDLSTKSQKCRLHDVPDDALDGPDWHREK